MLDQKTASEANGEPGESHRKALVEALVGTQLRSVYAPARRWFRLDKEPLIPTKKFSFTPLSASEILAHVEATITWLWEQYIGVGDLVLFTAFMKVGKSTFIYPLVLAVARGVPFLNRATLQGGVLVLALEEHVRDVKLRLQKLGMTRTDPVHVNTGTFPCTTEALEELEKFIAENKIVMVVLDSLSAYWEVYNENDNAEVIRKVKPLLDLARRTNCAMILIHHESKFGGQDESGKNRGDGKAIRGASALFGLADQALSLGKRAGNAAKQRVLRAIGRRAESPPELIIQLWGEMQLSDPKPYGYNVIGTPSELDEATKQANIAKVLDRTPKTLETIKSESGVSKNARQVLDALTEASLAVREGAGVRGDPHTWRLIPSGEGADS